jgi:hypothetical protein
MDISGYTSEQIKEIPELAHFYDVVLFMEKNKGKNLFPKKYEMSVLDAVTKDTHNIFKEHPNLPLNNVVATVLPAFKPDLSGDLILKMTQKIIETWEKLSSSVHQKERELETV